MACCDFWERRKEEQELEIIIEHVIKAWSWLSSISFKQDTARPRMRLLLEHSSAVYVKKQVFVGDRYKPWLHGWLKGKSRSQDEPVLPIQVQRVFDSDNSRPKVRMRSSFVLIVGNRKEGSVLWKKKYSCYLVSLSKQIAVEMNTSFHST